MKPPANHPFPFDYIVNIVKRAWIGLALLLVLFLGYCIIERL